MTRDQQKIVDKLTDTAECVGAKLDVALEPVRGSESQHGVPTVTVLLEGKTCTWQRPTFTHILPLLEDWLEDRCSSTN